MTSEQVDSVLLEMSGESLERLQSLQNGMLKQVIEGHPMDVVGDSQYAQRYLRQVLGLFGSSTYSLVMVAATFLEAGYRVAKLEQAERETAELGRMLGLDKIGPTF